MLDANALFLPFTQAVELDREIRRWEEGTIVVPASVIVELDELAARDVPAARLAREFARRFPTISAPGRGDAAILALATRSGDVVVTADRGLRDELARRGVRVLVPRDRSHLAPFARRSAVRSPGTVMNRTPLVRPRRRRRVRNARSG
ncbi:MAG TPA: hypothetical protein VGS18_00755 [Thermoplasmata archaeon]|nr:hypothetical protein [Thermoplasmata archaeon]